LRIDQPDGGGIGEILVRSDHCFIVGADGWRRTGDLGAIDEDGYLSLYGRTDDRIVRGGENIYPAEVEGALATHPAVREVAVVGVPDRRWGEVVKAVVVTDAGSNQPTAASLQSYLRPLIAHFKVPAVIEFVDSLPRTPSGKVLRRQLIRRDDT
jgi:long-chain acyl-CoA synthetase